jgi:hypothetical protein
MYIEQGRMPQFKTVLEEKKEKQEEDEVFYTPGPIELREARMEIAKYSIPLSTIRYFRISLILICSEELKDRKKSA